MRYLVLSPEPTYLDKVGSLAFVDGRATADDNIHPAELAYCRNSGYKVTALTEPELVPVAEAAPAAPAEPEPPAEPVAAVVAVPTPKRSASAEEWRAYAVTQGVPAEEAAVMSRNDLVERFAATGEGTVNE